MIKARNIDFYYGDFHALKGIDMDMAPNTVTAFIGPSGCGKSTFLRLFNRMNDLIPATKMTGELTIEGRNIYAKGVNVDELRKRVGMVFQKPNPFPKSIFENVAYGLRVNGIRDRKVIEQRVEESLAGAALCFSLVRSLTPERFTGDPILYSNSKTGLIQRRNIKSEEMTRTGYMVYNSFDPSPIFKNNLVNTFCKFLYFL